MFKHRETLKNWLIENSDKKIGQIALKVIAFTESSFFPIPPDPFLASYIMVKPKKWLNLSIIVSTYSVLGGIFGYLIGLWFFDLFGPRLIEFYSLSDEMVAVELFFTKYGFWSIFLSAFTPIPYKVFTISAGLFGVNFLVFVVASVIGRGLRFLIVGIIFRYIGEHYSDLIFKYFNLLSFLFGILVIAYLVIKFI
jgi:membrane protein YqaA with SNARE-associated domain